MMEKKGEEKPKAPGLGFLLIVLAGAAIIVALLAVYFGGTGGSRPGTGDPGLGTLETPQAKLLFSSFEKLEKLQDYRMEYADYSVGLPVEVALSSSGEEKSAVFKTEVTKEEVYSDGAERYVCETLDGERKCAKVQNSTLLSNLAEVRLGKLFDSASIRKERDRDEFLMRKGALNFTGGIVEAQVNGIPCRQIENMLDYRKLNVEELAVLGINAGDPVITVFYGFSYKRCFAESGVPILIEIKYKEAGQDRSYSRKIGGFGQGGQEIEIPLNLSNESSVEQMYLESGKKLAAYADCERRLNPQDRWNCYTDKAVAQEDPNYCIPIMDGAKKDRCYIALVSVVSEPQEMCGKVSGLKDDCYAQVALVTGDGSWCQRVENETLRQECLEQAGPECEADSDCVPAGCSSQACVAQGKAGETVTTCEVLPEYACLGRFGGCGCVQGSCAWKGGEALQACVDEARGNRTGNVSAG